MPKLRFSPTAWAKLLFLRDCGTTEVGGFGVTNAKDLLYVEDFVLIRQACSPVTVAFDDDSVAEFFDYQIDAGRRPDQCGRIWIHTHPGTSAEPSRVDEETFARVFGPSDWAVMAILACGGRTYARLQYHVGPGGSLRIPVDVDYTRPFTGTDWAAWKLDYELNVRTDEALANGWFRDSQSSDEPRQKFFNDSPV
jgi:proteasome lid subunit RPN8/RPN11